MDAEIAHWSFEHTKEELDNIWEKHLRTITVESKGPNEKEKFYGAFYRARRVLPCLFSASHIQRRRRPLPFVRQNEKEKFYGAFYRASFLPRTFNDVDGRYPSFAKGSPILQLSNGKTYPGQSTIGDEEKIGAYIHFKADKEESVLIKASSSFTGFEGAYKNMDAEIAHWSFEHTKE
ncbi:Glycosyl hydrolase family 92, partial [Popillia japonica]